MTDDSRIRAYKAAEIIHHRFLTGLILRTILDQGRAHAAELVFQLFRRQQQRTFLPGIEKLGLSDLPDAVKCAQYHYLSNYLGDVNVEYAYESDRKAWVRYPPPRWIFDGTAICGVPSEVSRAMMRGWHAQNGPSLGNPRLGFVCTKQTVDGQPGLEGYFFEYDHELAPDERLRFSPGEACPDFEPDAAPKLDVDDWPEERVRKALRNYAMEYARNILPTMLSVFGPETTRSLGRTTGKLIGMQYYGELAELLGVEDTSAEGFAEFLVRMGQGQGDDVSYSREDGSVVVQLPVPRILAENDPLHPALFDAWEGLLLGALSVHNRRLVRFITKRVDSGDGAYEWQIRAGGLG